MILKILNANEIFLKEINKNIEQYDDTSNPTYTYTQFELWFSFQLADSFPFYDYASVNQLFLRIKQIEIMSLMI